MAASLYRLSWRGNRRLNHALHIAVITQIRYPHSPGRRYYERKLAEGKTRREADPLAQATAQRRRLALDLVADAQRVVTR